jgi:hypothetical protein
MDPLDTDFLKDDREESVVGADVIATPRLHDQAPASAAHAGIDDREVHGSAAEMARAGEEHEGTGRDVKPRDFMRDVDKHSGRAADEHDPFHRGDERRAGSEIGREGDDRRR